MKSNAPRIPVTSFSNQSSVTVSDRFLALCDFDYVAAKCLEEDIDWRSYSPESRSRDGWHCGSLEDLAQAAFGCSDARLKQRIHRSLNNLKEWGFIETCLLKDFSNHQATFGRNWNPRTLVLRSLPAQISEKWKTIAEQWGFGGID